MSKPKLGPWHPASVKPVHVGVYQTRMVGTVALDGDRDWFNLWDGTSWCGTGRLSPDDAKSADKVYGAAYRWRGLAEKPA